MTHNEKAVSVSMIEYGALEGGLSNMAHRICEPGLLTIQNLAINGANIRNIASTIVSGIKVS